MGGLPFIGYNWSSWSTSYPNDENGYDPATIYKYSSNYNNNSYACCGYPFVDTTAPAATVPRNPHLPWINLLAGFYTGYTSGSNTSYYWYGYRGSSGVCDGKSSYDPTTAPSANTATNNGNNSYGISSHNTKTQGWVPGCGGSGGVVNTTNGNGISSGTVDYVGGTGGVVLAPTSLSSGNVNAYYAGQAFVTIEWS
jgi:hypothetical protein